MIMKNYPKYFLVGSRPVMFLLRIDGEVDAMAYEWSTGEFVKEMTYLTGAVHAARPCEITEEEFIDVVENLRRQLNEDYD